MLRAKYSKKTHPLPMTHSISPKKLSTWRMELSTVAKSMHVRRVLFVRARRASNLIA